MRHGSQDEEELTVITLENEQDDPHVHLINLPSSHSDRIELAKKIGTGIFAVVCVGVGTMMYINPSKTYAAAFAEGKWLSEKLGTSSWGLFYVSVASGVSASNLYLTAIAFPEFFKFLQEQPGTWLKIVKGSGIFLLAMTQNIQNALIAHATGGSPFIVLASSAASMPRNLYVTMSLIRNDLPYLIKKSKQIASILTFYTIYRCHLTEDERLLKRWLNDLRYIQSQFKKRIEKGWLTVLKNKYSLSLNNQLTLPEKWELIVVDLSDEEIKNEEFLSFLLRSLFRTAGVAASIQILLPLWLNGLNIFVNVIPENLAGNLLVELIMRTLAMFTSVSLSYLVPQFMVTIFDGVYDALKNLLQKNPINWLAFQMRPKTTIIVGAAATALNSLSYPTLLQVFRAVYHWEAKKALEINLSIDADIINLIGFLKFTSLGTVLYAESKFATNKLNKDLLSLSNAVVAAGKLAEEFNEDNFCKEFLPLEDEVKKKLLGNSAEKFNVVTKNEEFKKALDNHFMWKKEKSEIKEIRIKRPHPKRWGCGVM